MHTVNKLNEKFFSAHFGANCLVHIFLITIFAPNGEHNETVGCSSFISPKYTGHIFARKLYVQCEKI